MTRIKQDRTRRSGHKHSLNAQDLTPVAAYNVTGEQARWRTLAAGLTHEANAVKTIYERHPDLPAHLENALSEAALYLAQAAEMANDELESENRRTAEMARKERDK